MVRFALACLASALGVGETLAQTASGKLDYARDVQPILSTHCFNCHGPDGTTRKAGLRLDTAEGAMLVLRSGDRAVVPGDPAKSTLVARVHANDKTRMPPPKTPVGLSEAEKKTLARWVEEGAVYRKHWAFEVPRRPEVPKAAGIVRDPIDAFVQAKAAVRGLTPAPEADRHTLARRVALDLTGLPPSLDLVDRFVADQAPNAYEKYVDTVLASPAFGERWASLWLDVARYADSNGYAEDQARTIWKYRDWVIDAFNNNYPYDRFTVEQLAGDLLPNPTSSQLIATAFHRNTLTNTEGGTNDEEFRNIAVVDRVNTTLQTWMGITINCAQCHEHKYDPITQEEYFRLFAIFNQTEDADRSDNSPNHLSLSDADAAKKAAWEKDLAAVDAAIVKAMPDRDKRAADWALKTAGDKATLAKLPAPVQKALALDPAKRNPAQKAEILAQFLATVPETQKHQASIADLKAKLASVQPVPTPVMKELPEGKKRVTKIHVRGDWLHLGKEVQAGLPSAFPGLPKGELANRLGLARWLTSPENPLVARVAVNRFWEQVFGANLVDTPEDYGMRSKPPIHAELLDYLAVEFAGPMKWDVKQLLKRFVLSATYRQESKAVPAALERDPENRYFSRGPRFRVSAETVRDQALFAAGLLSAKTHGPSVRPPQPKLGLSAAFGPGTDWTTSAGEDRFRRGLYTYWRRTTPYPSMVTFDAPGRSVCSLTRPRTNTPLQALVTLNDLVYVEAAQALARRMASEGGKATDARIARGFRLVLVRPPHPEETARLVKLFDQTRAGLAKNVPEATALATDPIGPLPAGADPVESAALAVVANVILNLDETFAKR